MIERNAIIESARLDTGDCGVLTGWLMLDYGGSGQGFGGYTLYLPPSFKHSRNQGNLAGIFIYRVLEIAGVEEWSRLPGKTIRVRKKDEWETIQAIGHIVKDDWFDPKTEFAPLMDEKQ